MTSKNYIIVIIKLLLAPYLLHNTFSHPLYNLSLGTESDIFASLTDYLAKHILFLQHICKLAATRSLKDKGYRHGYIVLRTAIFKPQQFFCVSRKYFYIFFWPSRRCYSFHSLYKRQSLSTHSSPIFTVPFFFHQQIAPVCGKNDLSIPDFTLYFVLL